jgi:hypothetical protein
MVDEMIHNTVAALRLHYAHLILHAEQHTEYIGVESGGAALRGLFRHRTDLAFGAGVVDRHIKSAEAGYGLVEQVTDLLFVANVGVDKFTFDAETAEFLGQRMSRLVLTAGQDNSNALLGEGQCGGTVDNQSRPR